jgi:hypothetical protein
MRCVWTRSGDATLESQLDSSTFSYNLHHLLIPASPMTLHSEDYPELVSLKLE